MSYSLEKLDDIRDSKANLLDTLVVFSLSSYRGHLNAVLT